MQQFRGWMVLCAVGLVWGAGCTSDSAAPLPATSDASALGHTPEAGSPAVVCGDGACEAGETSVTCPKDCATGPAGCVAKQGPGCGGCPCEKCVCGLDAFCCDVAWDDTCVVECSADCGGACPNAPLPGCAPKASPGCDGCACQDCVCKADAYCCATAWDDLCVGACTGLCGMSCQPSASCGDGVCQFGEATACPQDCSPTGGGCVAQECAADVTACQADAACGQIVQCLGGCGIDATCADTCLKAAPAASGQTFSKLAACYSQKCLLACTLDKCAAPLQACQADAGCAGLALCALGCGTDLVCYDACLAKAPQPAKDLIQPAALCAAQQCPLALPGTPTVTEAKIQLNPDVGDPHQLTLTGPTATAWVYGAKNPDGSPSSFSKVVIDDGKRVLTVQFDAFGRPTSLADSTGRSAQLTYTATDVTVVFKAPDGVGDTVVLPLDKLPPDFPKATPDAFGGASQGLAAGDRPINVVTHVRVVQDGKPLQDLVDAQVIGTITNKSLKYPGAYDPAQGGYVFQFVHRTQPLDAGKAQCEKAFGTTADLATYIGGVAGLGTALCLFTPAAPACVWLSSTLVTMTGAGVGIAGAASTLKAKNCADLVVPADPNAMTVTVAVQHAAFGPGQGAGTYDLSSALDPVNKTGKLDLFVDYAVKPAILSIETVPPSPAAKQSYQFRFHYQPPGAEIEWTVTGSDKFTKSGKTGGGPTGTTALTDVIPGGAQGVKDTVTAALLVGGVKVATANWTFSFK